MGRWEGDGLRWRGRFCRGVEEGSSLEDIAEEALDVGVGRRWGGIVVCVADWGRGALWAVFVVVRGSGGDDVVVGVGVCWVSLPEEVGGEVGLLSGKAK